MPDPTGNQDRNEVVGRSDIRAAHDVSAAGDEDRPGDDAQIGAADIALGVVGAPLNLLVASFIVTGTTETFTDPKRRRRALAAIAGIQWACVATLILLVS